MPVLKDATVDIGGTDYSAFVRSVTLNYGAEETDDTAMGDDTRSAAGGLKEWDGEIEFFAGEGSGEPNADLFSQIGSTATTTIKRDSAAVAADNPEYTGTALFTGETPVEGTVGDQQMNAVSFVAAGDLSRATS